MGETLYIEHKEFPDELTGDCRRFKSIRGSGNKLRVSRKTITGNGNEIHGNWNIVRGNYNVLYGKGNEAIGIGNLEKSEPEPQQRERRRKREEPPPPIEQEQEPEERRTVTTYHGYGELSTMLTIFSSIINSPFVDLDSEPEPKRQKLLIPDEQDEEEDLSLEGKDSCAICKVKRKTVTIVDCGHKMFCVECMRTLLNDTNKSSHKCPICLKEIVYGAQKIKTYE